MHMIVVSLNHHTAPVEVREKFAFEEDKLSAALRELKQTKSILEGVIVSTCNRMEIYAVVDRLHMCGHYIREFMENWFGIPRSEFARFLHIHEDRRAIEHLFRVTCGLESMVIGETQILGQIRDAFLLAQREKATGTIFNMMFKQAVTLAKRAHTETGINDNTVSISYAAVEHGRKLLSHYHDRNVLMIGAGKMSELTVKHLQSSGVNRVYVANRTVARAEELTGELGGKAVSLDQIDELIASQAIDVIISSTGSQGYVLSKAQVEQALSNRSNQPLLLIDIAVPRDIDPTVAQIPNVSLYDIDDLQEIIDSNLEARMQVAAIIERMIDKELALFQHWYRTLGVSPVIRALQEKADSIHQETMDSLLNKLPDLSQREIKVIRKLSKSIANQMMHDPIMRIKELAAEQGGEEAIQLFTHLFALEDSIKTGKAGEANTMLEEETLEETESKSARSAEPFLTPVAYAVSARG